MSQWYHVFSVSFQVGLKNIADYGSDANTDDLADDSDLDTSTCEFEFFALFYIVLWYPPSLHSLS